MEWAERHATGIPEVDVQHKMLFRMTDDFRTALNEGKGEGVYEGLLQSLDLYVRTHFRYEEGCMEKYACPAAEGNRNAHLKFVETLSGFQVRYASRGFDRSDSRQLVDTLDHWLDNHIGRLDVQLKKSVQEAETTG
jgi:hemerythrin